MMKIGKKESRKIIIQSAGFGSQKPFGSGKEAVVKAIAHLGYVQIDTISVIERAHHHVLASRIPGYRKNWLSDLQRRGKVLEYWSHAAAYLPMEDFRYTLPLKRFFADSKDRWPKSDKALMKKVLQRVRNEGPLMARDFQTDKKREGLGWWDWKPAKLALERLFFQGSLVTVDRQGFQKIYDLPENYIPGYIDTREPSDEEYAEYLIDRALNLHGIVSFKEITYLRKNGKKTVKDILNQKLRDKYIIKVTIDGLEGQEYLSTPELIDKMVRAPSEVKILSPFDNMTIQRNRLRNFFDFEYQIECYMPESKRIFGYFSLPILYGEQFVGRMDAKADRKNRRLIIKNFHFEKHYRKIAPAKFLKSLQSFSEFNNCEEIVTEKTNDMDFLKEIMDFRRQG